MSDTFVLELPLEVPPSQAVELSRRFHAARQLYNACLGECLRRISLIRQSRWWTQAKRLRPREKGRSELFKTAIKHYAFSEYDLHSYVCTLRNSCWLLRHIDANTAQKIATRAYQAANDYLRKKRGKP